jgi:hypothetical protein
MKELTSYEMYHHYEGKWTKRKLIRYLRKIGYLDKRPGYFIPTYMQEVWIPKNLRKLKHK